jgi:hypothetical protein
MNTMALHIQGPANPKKEDMTGTSGRNKALLSSPTKRPLPIQMDEQKCKGRYWRNPALSGPWGPFAQEETIDKPFLFQPCRGRRGERIDTAYHDISKMENPAVESG